MKNILLFGAGKSATVLIDYLIEHAEKEQWRLTVVDADIVLAKSKIGNSSYAIAVSFDINDAGLREKYISESDIVISLLPPSLHTIAALSCIELNKNLLTASYIDPEIKKLEDKILNKKLLFLCEMGLDPGIDHMSAMKLFDKIRNDGGRITSFKSHCGGLIVPESDNNPWHYKISWNPRNILLAGKSGAHYLENGKEIKLSYEELFSPGRDVNIQGAGRLSWYPNRDSLSYATLYGLEQAETLIRTTLRHPDFMMGWHDVIRYKLTDEAVKYSGKGKMLADFFEEHLKVNNLSKIFEEEIGNFFELTASIGKELELVLKNTIIYDKEREKVIETILTTNDPGDIESFDLGEKANEVKTLFHNFNKKCLPIIQLSYLGFITGSESIPLNSYSAADVTQLALESKLALQPEDKDMIVMFHEIEYADRENRKLKIESSLVVKGQDSVRTAMAKTVGLPLGIAAKLILNGTIKLTGLHIPTPAEIYLPVLAELKKNGIIFHEESKFLS